MARLLRGENLDDHRLNGERRLLRTLARAAPNGIVFDVGANVGRWSVEAARLLPDASLHAFEPHPAAFARLRESTAALEVECHQLAFGDEPGSATLHFDPELTVMSSLHARDLEAHGMALDSSVEVEVARLDDYCDEHDIDSIDILKIDVEGHEHGVLAGAQRRLADERVGLVQFEYGGAYLDAGVRLRDVLELFPASYSVSRIVPWGLMPLTDADLRQESFALSNYVAALPAWAARLA